jgi:hypothetical protein
MAMVRVGRYPANAVSNASLAVLLSPLAKAKATGVITWAVKKPNCHEGQVGVTTVVENCMSGRLRIYFVTPRPDRIHLQYLVNGVPIRRLDVNDAHRRTDQTHKHTYQPPDGESFYIPDDIPEVPRGPTVAPGIYRRVFDAFARECHILLADGYWVEPEMGR